MMQPDKSEELSEKILVYLKTNEVVELAKLSIEHLTNNIYEEWEYAGFSDPLGQATATIINTITNALKPVIDAVKSVVDSIWSKVSSIYDYVKDIPSKITELSTSISSSISGFVSSIKSTIESAIGGVVNQIRSWIENLGDKISSISESVRNTVSSVVSGIKDTITSIVGNLENTIRSTFSTLSDLVKRIPETINRLSSEFVSKLTELGMSIQQGIRSVVDSVTNAIKPILQGIVERIRSGFSAIRETFTAILHQIETTIGDLPKILSGFADSVRKTVTSIVSQIVKTVENLPSALNKVVQDIFGTFKTWFSAIMDGIGQISATFRGFVNPLVEIKNWIESKFTSAWKWIYENVAKPIYEGLVKKIVDALKSFVGDPLGTLKSAFDKLHEFFENVKEKAKDLFAPIVDAFEKFVKDPLGSLADAFKPVVDFFENVEEKAKKMFEPIVKQLEKIDLGSIPEKFEDFWTNTEKAIGDALSWMKTALYSTWNFVANEVVPFFESFENTIIGIAKRIGEWIVGTFGKVVDEFKEFGKNVVDTIVVKPLKALTGVDKWVKENESVLKLCGFQSPTNRVYEGYKWFLTTIVLGHLPLEIYGFYWLSRQLRNTNAILKAIRVAITPILAKLGIRVSPTKLKESVFDAIELITKEWIKTMLFTTSFWIYEPFKYFVNPFVRWNTGLPHEIPTYHEIVHSTRRFLPCKLLAEEGKADYGKMFDAMIHHLHEIMDYRAFPFWFEAITLGEHTPDAVFERANIPKLFSFEIKDRFGTTREIPMLLLYELPTPSDTVRMMLRDVIQDLKDFEKIMAMHGFKKDITAMYYLLHFRYPSPSSLFEFVSRVAGGVVWFSPSGKSAEILQKEKQSFLSWGLGFEPKPPTELAKTVERYELPKPSQTPASIDTSKIDEIVLKRFNEIVGYIMPYFKWHDYFPMAWVEGFTSDQMIAIELSADIPQRIDARWMFKWGIISDTDLLRIVMARGMHPAWASKITIAEIMNAMSEERTVVRTGIINAFKEGFTTEENLKKQFKHLCDLEILGVKVPVVFLEGEAKLLTLRAKYDRAIDILRDLVRQCVHGYQHNVYDFTTFKSKIKKVVDTLAKTLKIPLKFDESYYNAYKDYLDVYHEVDTINRIRSWIRYSMYQLLYRFTRGYVPKSQAKELVDLFVDMGKLTEEERKVFETLMEFMLQGYVNEVKVRAVLRKLSRGVISLEEARNELKSLHIPDDLVEALIEAYARLYTLSISSYLSYADYVKIDENLLVKKLELLGVPEDEREIILQVFRIKPIRTEMSRAIERLLDMFENGYLTEEELKKMLQQYKLSRVGIEFLILASKFKRDSYKAKLYVDAVIHEFKRGAISLSEAKKKLKEVIKDEEIIDCILEKNARIYEFSVDKLISMREYVPIDINKVIEKAKEFGYPEDEIKLIPAYVVARELNEEIHRVANELGNDFVNGVITEDEFRRALDELATLNGQAKSKLGVDWIVLSPEERELLVTLYKLRKMRKSKGR